MVGGMGFMGFNAKKRGRIRHVLMVCHTSYPKVRGGIDAMIATLIKAMPDDVRVSIFSPGDWSQQRLTVQWQGKVACCQLRLRLPWDAKRPVRGFLGWLWEFPGTMWTLWNWLRQEGVEVIHLHTVKDYQLYFRWLRWLGGPPYMVTFHGTDALNFATGTLLGVQGEQRDTTRLRWVVQGAAAVTTVADHLARLIQQYHPQLGRVYYIPNGISLEREAGPLVALPEGFPDHYWLLAGWVEPPKAPDVAVRAWGLLKERFPDLHLLIVGGESVLGSGLPYYPGYGEALRTLVAQNSIEATVHFTGSVPREILLLLAQHAQGLVFPSLREGLPYVLLEAGLARLPVVVSDIPAFVDVVTHEQDGLIFATGEAGALANAVAQIEEDPTLARRLGEALYAKICRDYSAQRMAHGYFNIYQHLGDS